jgi:hypothetical protein
MTENFCFHQTIFLRDKKNMAYYLFKQEKDDGLTLTYLNKENELPLSVTHEVTYAAGIET